MIARLILCSLVGWLLASITLVWAVRKVTRLDCGQVKCVAEYGQGDKGVVHGLSGKLPVAHDECMCFWCMVRLSVCACSLV